MRKGFREGENYEGRKLWLWEKPLAYMLQEMEQEQEGKRVQHDNLEGQALHKIKYT